MRNLKLGLKRLRRAGPFRLAALLAQSAMMGASSAEGAMSFTDAMKLCRMNAEMLVAKVDDEIENGTA